MSDGGFRKQAGFTLVELMVVLVLFGAVGTVVTSAIVTSLRSAQEATARTTAIHELEVSLQRMGRELRAADPFYLSDASPRNYGDHLGAEVFRDRKVRVLSYEVVGSGDDQRLVQDTTEFDLDEFMENEDATPVSSPQRELVTDIDNGGAPVFRYYDSNGAEISCDPSAQGVPLDEGEEICDDRYAGATKIRIRLVRDVEGSRPIGAETHINVRNTRYGEDD